MARSLERRTLGEPHIERKSARRDRASRRANARMACPGLASSARIALRHASNARCVAPYLPPLHSTRSTAGDEYRGVGVVVESAVACNRAARVRPTTHRRRWEVHLTQARGAAGEDQLRMRVPRGAVRHMSVLDIVV